MRHIFLTFSNFLGKIANTSPTKINNISSKCFCLFNRIH